VALLKAIEEDHAREGKGASSRGRRELLNLECSINYESTCASSRRGKGKAHVV
jgi:tRNA(His) 5'-end guanylyltransferase